MQTDTSPAEDYFPIAPSDVTPLTKPVRAISVAVGGNVSVIKPSGATVVLTLPAGLFPIRVTQVNATATTATGLVGYV